MNLLKLFLFSLIVTSSSGVFLGGLIWEYENRSRKTDLSEEIDNLKERNDLLEKELELIDSLHSDSNFLDKITSLYLSYLIQSTEFSINYDEPVLAKMRGKTKLINTSNRFRNVGEIYDFIQKYNSIVQGQSYDEFLISKFELSDSGSIQMVAKGSNNDNVFGPFDSTLVQYIEEAIDYYIVLLEEDGLKDPVTGSSFFLGIYSKKKNVGVFFINSHPDIELLINGDAQATMDIIDEFLEQENSQENARIISVKKQDS